MATIKRRYSTLTPTTGLAQYDGQGAYIEDRQYLDHAYDPSSDGATQLFEDQLITFAEVPDDGGLRLVELPFEVAGTPTGTDETTSEPFLQVWTAATKTGTQFTVILEDQSFDTSPGSLEIRAYLEGGKLDFSSAQLAAEGVSVAYVTYLASNSYDSALEKAEIRQEIKKVQEVVDALGSGGSGSGGQAVSFAAPAGEVIDDDSIAYIGLNGLVWMLDDPSDLDQITSAVWVVDGGSTGSTITCHVAGSVEFADLPINKAIRIGNNSQPTYHGDTVNPIVSGDWIKDIGHSFDGQNLILSMHNPPTAKK